MSKASKYVALEKQALEIEFGILETLIKNRKAANISQANLGEMCGMLQPALGRIEGKKISPSIRTLLKILIPLGYTLKIEKLKK